MAVKRFDKKRKLTCTLPDGTQATRTTDRVYTHVVVARMGIYAPWKAQSWHSNKALADKSRWEGVDCCIVEVDPVYRAPLLTIEKDAAIKRAMVAATDLELRRGLSAFIVTLALQSKEATDGMTGSEAVISAITALTQKIEGSTHV